MGTKKITDLQLISAVTADISIPGDTGIQTYRLTVQQLFDFILANQNITLPMLKNDIFTGLTGVTAADDDYFPFVDISDSNKTKKGLVGAFRNAPLRSVTTTDTATASDETLKLSGASFTQTLPANGTAGKRIKLVHAGTSISQVYTLATQGGATIGGVASGAFAMYTNGELLSLEDDGTNWIIVGRHTETGWVTTTSPTITNFGTPTLIYYNWKRQGQDCIFNVSFVSGSPVSSLGSISIPGTAASSTIYPRTYTRVGTWNRNTNGAECGTVLLSAAGTALFFSVANGTGADPLAPVNSNSIVSNLNTLAFEARVTMAGWQP